ncbi:hypothetical protein GIB67_005139 [Kingdonia uniflora]|uniref:Uncharacterized protein n=1 Tax=Kingdonia uniflora TaxID=39325 RepID=A0A7J7LAA7_9MAGN|nr:hypothetical protein GIB67_005139 [Kingdonia uniflora]
MTYLGLVQERLSSFLQRSQNFLNQVTAPLVKTGQDKSHDAVKSLDTKLVEEIFISEQTIDSKTPNGSLSLAAIVSIEQFSRMNGLTGRKMQKIYEALVPQSLHTDARNLVEYCCFRFLSRDSSDVHPCLKRKLIGEEAFARIASSVAGVADMSTAHNLFRALAGYEQGISFSSWTTYIQELLKVHEGRKSYYNQESTQLSTEKILCIGSSKKRPVLKWENNIPWPGKIILTDKALYFEAIGLKGKKELIRLDLTRDGSRVEKTRVGPLGSELFDSAVSVTSGSESKTWVLELVDFGGEMRRDAWHAFISEVVSLYGFIREYGPKDGDESVHHVYGAQKGKMRATMSAINSVTRVQALQCMRKISDDPIKLVQFSYLRKVPYGDIVCQTLAVNFWGGPLVTKLTEADHLPAQGAFPSEDVFDIDGSVYLRKWMRSPSWQSNTSLAFWKNSSVKQGVILSKSLVVSDTTHVERASVICKKKSQVVEKTQATIDAALLKGIPSNIDLFQELMVPLTGIAKSFEELRRWKKPHRTVFFLAFAYTIIFRNMLSYIFPVTLMIMAFSMLLLKGLKEQGRLGRSFGKVTIRDQPPSNTIQTILAFKKAMLGLENNIQNLNVTLLKIRTILLSGQPQITTEVALVLLFSSTILLIVPFRFVLAWFMFDLFTRELEFRREMVTKFMSFLKERWETVPAAPVVVLPFESEENRSGNPTTRTDRQEKFEKTQIDK